MNLRATVGGSIQILDTFGNFAWRDLPSQAVTALVVTKVSLGLFYRISSNVTAPLLPLTQLLLVEVLKLAISVVWWTHERRLALASQQYIQLEDGDPLVASPEPSSRDAAENSLTDSSVRLESSPSFTILGVLLGISVLNCAVGFSGIEAQRLAVPGAVHIFGLFVPLLCAGLIHFLSQKSISTHVWNSLLFQFAGLALVQCGANVSSVSVSGTMVLLGRVYLQSLLLTGMDYVFKASGYPSSFLSAIVWGLSSILYLVTYLLYSSDDLSSFSFSIFGLAVAVALAVEATATILVLKYHDTVIVGVTSYSVSLTLGLASVLIGPANFSLVIIIGLGISVYGLGIFVSERTLKPEGEEQKDPNNYSEEPSLRDVIMLSIVGVTAIILTIALSSQRTGKGLQSPQPTAWFDFASLPPPQSKAWCPRRPLPKLSGRKFKQGTRTPSAFDNILLIVFFSHARYDINLPYHLEMYEDYFPNIVYVGPQTREDEGHKGTYDVLVDGFKSDEDLSGSWYKMAGRMAHHMLYTAMREHPCYDGYLWAPFDTFLNVPRLMQFRQDTIWWHSPFEHIITYVDNPANLNASHHAPPGTIQPGSAKDLISNFRHWGKGESSRTAYISHTKQTDYLDWWWGEPHVGLQACMPAFEKAPATQRNALSKLTDGNLRMVGGSADTLYLPGYLRELFLETLDPFLDTDCFLEIAIPTVLHLVRPPTQKISFVDHWWIWQEPLNATFVRNQWSKGYEVDTFHKYQFGSKDENGHFQGNQGHLSAVRDLLADSFRRQGMA